MNPLLTSPEVEQYLREHISMDASDLSLKGSPFPGLTSGELAAQLVGLQLARRKLPSWFASPGIHYPTRRALEQCSSEAAARHKASLFESIAGLWDLCGGMGVDSWALGTRAESLTYVEPDPELHGRSLHNLRILGLGTHLRSSQTGAIDFLRDQPGETDLAYLDPDRRVSGTRRSLLWAESEPNVAHCLDLLRGRARRVLIKGSPMLDLSRGATELQSYKGGFGLAAIWVVALAGEVKELLFLLKAGEDTPLDSVPIAVVDPVERLAFDFRLHEETNAAAGLLEGPLGEYLYEPHAALRKAGVFRLLGQRMGLVRLNASTHLYSADRLIAFPGRSFRVLDSYRPHSKALKKWKGKQANVLTRNFPETPEGLRKRFGIRDGGQTYLIFCTVSGDTRLVIEALRAEGLTDKSE